jgi:hypothetical protein
MQVQGEGSSVSYLDRHSISLTSCESEACSEACSEFRWWDYRTARLLSVLLRLPNVMIASHDSVRSSNG